MQAFHLNANDFEEICALTGHAFTHKDLIPLHGSQKSTCMLFKDDAPLWVLQSTNPSHQHLLERISTWACDEAIGPKGTQYLSHGRLRLHAYMKGDHPSLSALQTSTVQSRLAAILRRIHQSPLRIEDFPQKPSLVPKLNEAIIRLLPESMVDF